MNESTEVTAVQNAQGNSRGNSRGNSLGTKAKAGLIVAGTVAVIVVAVIAFQFLRPKEGTAGENLARSEASAGRVSMRGSRQALARVNGELVGYDLVADECMQRYGQEVLENCINRMIIYQACRKKGIEVTEAEVNDEIIKIAKKFDIDPANWLKIIQSERHLSQMQYKQDVIWPMLALKRLAGTQVKITEAEMQRAFVRDYGERVKARMIMCDKLSRAQDAYNLVAKDPSNFGRIARQRSIDPTSKSIDGQIQPIRRYAGNDNLEKEAFKLKEGEISGIIDVSTPEARRYVILMCEGRTTPIVKSLDEPGIRDQVRRQLEEEKTQVAVAQLFQRLKKEAQVDNFLTNTSTVGIQPTSGTADSQDRVRHATGLRNRQRRSNYPATEAARRATSQGNATE